MQKRDTVILSIAIGCGFLAFMLVTNVLRGSAVHRQAANAPIKKHSKAISIPSGMRGLTIQASDIESIPNPINIGSYADVLGLAPNYVGKMEVQTIARSIQIVNVDQPNGSKNPESEVKSITVSLSPIAAEVVSKAMVAGKIHLIISTDIADTGNMQLGAVGITEIIRGISKEKSMRVER